MEMRGAGVQSLFVMSRMLCSAVLPAIEEWLVGPSSSSSLPPPLTTSSILLISSTHITLHHCILDALLHQSYVLHRPRVGLR